MIDGYSDRMIRPHLSARPMVSFVREGHRLIPIPVGNAVAVPVAPYRPEGPQAHACEPQVPQAQPESSTEDARPDGRAEGE